MHNSIYLYIQIKSNTTGATGKAETAYRSAEPGFNDVLAARSLVSVYFVYNCLSLFF